MSVDLYMIPKKHWAAPTFIPMRKPVRPVVDLSEYDRCLEKTLMLRHRIDTLAKWIAEHERVRARYHWQSEMWGIETVHIRFFNTAKLRFERQYDDAMLHLETCHAT